MIIVNIILRLISYPFLLALIIIKYNAYALIHSILFLCYGGEWITYAEKDKITIQDIFDELKKQRDEN